MFDKRLMALCPESKKYIVGNILLQWLELCMNAVMIGLIAKAAERLYRGELTPQNAAPGLVVILVTIILRFFVVRYAVRMSYLASRTVKRKLRDLIYKKLLKLGMSYREKVTTAEIVQESVEGVDQLESYFGQYVPQFFYAFIAPLTLFVIFWAAGSLRTGLVLLLCVPLIPGTIMMVQKIAKKILAKYWDQYTQLGSTFLENLQGMTTLKIYQADEYKHEQMNRESEQFRVVTMKVLTMQLNSVTIMDFVAYGGSAIGCILTARAYLNGGVNFGQAIAMVMLSAEFFLAMRALGSYFHTAMNGVAASERMFRLLDLPEKRIGTETAENGDIVIENLNFSYDGNKQALREVSLTVPQGALVSVVGESGCGKSTLAAILSGLRTGYDGSVKYGKAELRDAKPDSLRELVTVVSSGSYLFAGTVRDCLRDGKADASDAEMTEALRRVALWDFLAGQGGLDFQLNERAENISGGQRQRLALARALLKNSPIYILDEATSNIDAESEEVIMRAVRAMKGQHTILLISHRLANVVDSDCIAYLELGALKETGTHADLMARHGGYAALYQAQADLERYGREAAQ